MSIFNRYKYAKNYKRLLIAAYAFTLLVFAIKLVYTAQLPAVIDFFKTTKANATLGLTIYYFVYAAAQIALGFYITKINFKNYLLITSLLSAISFSLISVIESLPVIWAIFAINGFFQAASWGGIVYITSKYLPNETLSYSSKFLATASAVGNAVTYGVSAFFVEVSDWRITFVFFGILFLISIVYLFIQIGVLDKIIKRKDEYSFEYIRQENDNSSVKQKTTYVVPFGVNFNVKLFMTFIIAVSFLANCLIYGLGNWIPNLLKDVHGFPTSLSILLTMIMPLISMFATIFMYRSFDKSSRVFSKTGFMAIILLGLTVVMVFGFDKNFIFAILMCALLKYLPTAVSAGYNSYTLVKIKNYINSGTSTLIVNSGAAIAAGLMPFITGAIMDNFGWAIYYEFMAVICLLLVVLIFVGNAIIKKKNNITTWF